MKYLSLFSGIGGFELGIQQAYENNKTFQQESIGEGSERDSSKRQRDISNTIIRGEKPKQEQGHRMGKWVCIGFSEIDKYASQIYQSHFPTHKPYGDITKIKAEDLPEFDLIVGGFPCQSFSIAGKRGGFADTRGTLFFDIARIIKAKQPRLLLLENVKGLLSHDKGDTFRVIIATLDELGYDLQWQVLNSKNFGVPQNRERVFIIGNLRGTRRPEVFPFGDNSKKVVELPGQCSNTLTARYYGGQANGTYVLEGKQYAQEDLMVRDGRDNRSCLRAGRTPEIGIAGQSIRRLTPTECMRLQGFPDKWCDEVSDTQKYKCAGNAVTVNVIQEIFHSILHAPLGN